MKLINGKGQLGEALKKKKLRNDWTVYHTWDFINKNDLIIQKQCFLDFINYVNSHQNEKICFISTLSSGDTPYTRYKKLAEEYLKNVITDYKIVRICGIIGKGVCQDFREDKKKPHGIMTLASLSRVVNYIVLFLDSKQKDLNLIGENISASLAYDLIQYGKNGKA